MGQPLPNCTAPQRFDRLYDGGWPGNDISHRAAACRLRMKRTSTQFRDNFPRGCLQSGVFILCIAVVALSGCSERKVKASTFPWSASAHMRPLSPEVQQTHLVDASDLIPDLQLEVAPPPSTLVLARSVPALPRAQAAAAPQNEASTKAAVPRTRPPQ